MGRTEPKHGEANFTAAEGNHPEYFQRFLRRGLMPVPRPFELAEQPISPLDDVIRGQKIQAHDCNVQALFHGLFRFPVLLWQTHFETCLTSQRISRKMPVAS